MKKMLLPAFFILIFFTQISCNRNDLNTVNLNEKFINVSMPNKKKTNNSFFKSAYSKAEITDETSDIKLTGNLTNIKEFQVNSFGAGNGYSTPVVAMNNNNHLVVTWKQQSDIFAQIYDNNGVPKGEEFTVNNPEHIIYNEKKSPAYINTMDSPKIAIDDNGNFIVVWERLQRDFNSLQTVNIKSDIFARSFDSEGKPLNNEFKVNTSGNELHKYPAIARNGNGDFIISWSNYDISSGNQFGSSNGIYARKFTSSGHALNQFLVNNITDEKFESSVAINNDGKFVVSWYNLFDNNIYAKLFESNGKPTSNNFKVNNSISGVHGLPKVAMDRAGNFVITWQKTSGDGSYFGVFARKYNNDGIPDAPEFRVNSYTNNPYDQYEPAIAMSSNGNFIITWQNLNQNIKGEAGIFAQKFRNSGKKLGNEFLVKTYRGVEKTEPSAAIDSTNKFVITWANAGIHAKIFNDKNF